MKKSEVVMLFLVCVAFSICMWVLVAHAASGSVKLGFDYPDPPADLAGFRIYASTTAGGQTIGPDSPDLVTDMTYDPSITQHLATANMTVPDGAETELFFVATAYDESGNESGPSNEVSKRYDFLAPHIIVEITIVAE